MMSIHIVDPNKIEILGMIVTVVICLCLSSFRCFFTFIEAINNDCGVICEFTSLMNVERIQKNRIS